MRSGKSTLLNLGYVLWSILGTPQKKCVVIISKIDRNNKFRMGLLGVKTKEKKVEINGADYAAYLLREGTLIEKRELLSCFKSKLTLKDKKISLE